MRGRRILCARNQLVVCPIDGRRYPIAVKCIESSNTRRGAINSNLIPEILGIYSISLERLMLHEYTVPKHVTRGIKVLGGFILFATFHATHVSLLKSTQCEIRAVLLSPETANQGSLWRIRSFGWMVLRGFRSTRRM